ncbi:MAG: biotin/lipoyl-binding protein [Odoribacter sp.]|nr:biotin/lipoyl-binding protein [Odoribacter sp.]
MNKYKITIDGNSFDVTVNVTDHNKANVEVNGIAYDVVYESKNVTAPTPVVRKASAPAAPQVQVSAPQAASSASSIKAPLPGTISAINVKVGDQVKRGDTVIVMEAMKMENNIVANKDGKVKTIHVTAGQSVAQDDKLIDLE